MAIGKKELISEQKHKITRSQDHKINSPLAAIRNALYLTAARVCDPEVKRYLKLADEEVSWIAMVLNKHTKSMKQKLLSLSKRI